jgi:hypothetical protein
MSGPGAITHSDGGGTYVKGYGAAEKEERSQPFYQAYVDDQNFYQPVQVQGTVKLQISQAKLESYYQYLPPLTRGVMVPNGYPLLRAGFLLEPNFFPRIVACDYDSPEGQAISWTYPDVADAKWSEALSAANPGLKNSPPKVRSTVTAMLSAAAAPHTKVVQKDSTGKACGWYNAYYGVYFSYAPHLLFDTLLRAGKIFADPTSTYFQSEYGAWLEPSWGESLRNFAEAVVVALAIAYIAAYAGADGSAAADGGGDAATGTTLAPTEIAAPPVDTSVTTTLTTTDLTGTAVPLDAVSTTVGAASAAADVTAADGGLDALENVGSAVAKDAAAVVAAGDIAAAKQGGAPATAVVAPLTIPAGAFGSLSPTTVAIIVGSLLLFGVALVP